jgi:hypothetical protein
MNETAMNEQKKRASHISLHILPAILNGIIGVVVWVKEREDF